MIMTRLFSCFRLVVGSDGGNSAIRRLAGIGSWGWAYGQTAVVCTVGLDLPPSDPSLLHTNPPDNTTAWQIYLQTGPLALLPLNKAMSSIVWSLPTPEAHRIAALHKEDLVGELNEAFQQPFNNQFKGPVNLFKHTVPLWPSFLQPSPSSTSSSVSVLQSLLATTASKAINTATKLTQSALNEVHTLVNTISDTSTFQQPFKYPPKINTSYGDPALFPLTLQQASHYAVPRIALIGDAAHSIHPQAGQGLNMGIRDVQCLSEVLVTALASGADIGTIQVLEKYSKPSYTRNMSMLATVDTINTIFSLGKNTRIPHHNTPVTSSTSTNSSSTHSSSADDTSSSSTTEGTGEVGVRVEAQESNISNIAHDVRALGMLSVNSFRIVKKYIAKYAMGT